jgi:hypothetical protein
MQKWDYETFFSTDGVPDPLYTDQGDGRKHEYTEQEHLKRRGLEGWELIGVASEPNSKIRWFYLKRPKEDMPAEKSSGYKFEQRRGI